jgi:hypothetical protein
MQLKRRHHLGRTVWRYCELAAAHQQLNLGETDRYVRAFLAPLAVSKLLEGARASFDQLALPTQTIAAPRRR